jgi:hypothetical protein
MTTGFPIVHPNGVTQEPDNPKLEPVINIHSGASFIKADNTTAFGEFGLHPNIERAVDFESLRVNKNDVRSILLSQQWDHYFEMLNGPVYYDLVRKLWSKAYVFDRIFTDNQEAVFLSKNPDDVGLTREQMGLEPFRKTEIRCMTASWQVYQFVVE